MFEVNKKDVFTFQPYKSNLKVTFIIFEVNKKDNNFSSNDLP